MGLAVNATGGGTYGSAAGEAGYRGGPWVRVTLLVERWPDGLTQVTEMTSPGWSLDTTAVRLSGAPMACPLTAVITEPVVRPAAAAGPLQMVPMIRVPELTGAMAEGAGSPRSLV